MYSKASKTFKQTPNVTCARLAFELFAASPGLKLKDLKCPMLVVMAEEDDITPPEITRDIVEKALGSTYASFVSICRSHVLRRSRIDSGSWRPLRRDGRGKGKSSESHPVTVNTEVFRDRDMRLI